MKQYLLSVYSVEGEGEPSPEVIQQIFKDVDALNAEMQAQGVEVFGGGLEAADHGDGGPDAGRRRPHHRWALR